MDLKDLFREEEAVEEIDLIGCYSLVEPCRR